MSRLQDGGEREQQRLIEVIVSGLSREAFDAVLMDLSGLIDERWPQFGAAVAGRYSLPEQPHQDAERLRDALRMALVELEPEGGTDPWRDSVIQKARAALAPSPNATQLGSEQSAPNTTAEKLGRQIDYRVQVSEFERRRFLLENRLAFSGSRWAYSHPGILEGARTPTTPTFSWARFSASLRARTEVRLGMRFDHAWEQSRDVCFLCGLTRYAIVSARRA